ncbi:MAG: helix-turn-helix domain-containing protein [Gemmatimonadales bacterium]
MNSPAPLGPPRYCLGGYREHHPPPALQCFAEALWTHRAPDELPPGAGAMHRVLPDPSLNLAFSCRRGPGGVPTEPELIIIGPKTRPHIFAFRAGHELAAVRLKLEWARALLGLVPEEHHDAEDDLTGVLPGLAGAMLGPLTETRDAREAVARLVGMLARRAGCLHPRGPALAAHALDLVRRAIGRVTVDQVAGRMGIPLRSLRRQVRRDAGISLKQYARITRLLHAVTTADRSPAPVWAAIAADTGFCDQSHLVRECRALSGLAPGQVYRERRAQAETSNPG